MKQSASTNTASSTTPTMNDASNPPPDFFASDAESDSGGDIPTRAVSSDPELGGLGIPSPQTSSEDFAPGNPLFLLDDEDLDHEDLSAEKLCSVPVRPNAHRIDDMNMEEVFGIPPEKKSKPTTRRQPEEVPQPSRKRRKRSPSSDPDFFAFVGCMVVPNAWSTVKGKGYVKNGDPIFVEWDRLKQEEDTPKGSDKKKKKPAQKKGKKLTINTHARPRQENFKTKKQNDIVRLTIRGGFGELTGRCSTQTSVNISFRGRTVTPERR